MVGDGAYEMRWENLEIMQSETESHETSITLFTIRMSIIPEPSIGFDGDVPAHVPIGTQMHVCVLLLLGVVVVKNGGNVGNGGSVGYGIVNSGGNAVKNGNCRWTVREEVSE